MYFNIQSLLPASIKLLLRKIKTHSFTLSKSFYFFILGLLLNETALADIDINGFISGGINYNPASPPQGNNGPVSMTDQSGNMNLYQLNLAIEKVLSKKSAWEIGGRIDTISGTDTRYSQATRH